MTTWSAHPRDIGVVRSSVPCQWACPAHTDVPAYIRAILEGRLEDAYRINRRANLLPGVLGRICSRPCEEACRHGEPDLGESVGICHLKRVAADRTGELPGPEPRLDPTGHRVAVVGAGPAGLAAGHSLALLGHDVTIYEACDEPGGMLRYGIPAFRLPRDVLTAEVEGVLGLGIALECGVRLGRDVGLEDLLDRHDAVILAAGCYAPRSLRVPGEELPGVITGLDFVMKVNRGEPVEVGRRVLVIGGGFTAMDCGRMTRRMGAKEVSIHVRRVEEELEVTREEILETKREGVRVHALVSPVEVLGGERVRGVRFIRNRLGPADKSGRRRPIPLDGSEFEVPADTVISAIGQSPIRELAQEGRLDDPRFDSETGVSNHPGLFAAGDFLHGASTVIEAVGHGRKAAGAVDTYLTRLVRRREELARDDSGDTTRERSWDYLPRQEMPMLPMKERLAELEPEVETGLDDEGGSLEARRCYQCDLRYEIDLKGCIFCRLCVDECPRDCIELAAECREGEIRSTHRWSEVTGIIIDSDRCIRCGICHRVCPTRCIHVSRVRLDERTPVGEVGAP